MPKALVALDRLVPSIAEEHASKEKSTNNEEPASKEEPTNGEEPASDEEHASKEEPESDKELASNNLSLLQQDIVGTRNETSNIFNLPDLKCVMDSLDFNTSEQMSRDGSKRYQFMTNACPTRIQDIESLTLPLA